MLLQKSRLGFACGFCLGCIALLVDGESESLLD